MLSTTTIFLVVGALGGLAVYLSGLLLYDARRRRREEAFAAEQKRLREKRDDAELSKTSGTVFPLLLAAMAVALAKRRAKTQGDADDPKRLLH